MKMKITLVLTLALTLLFSFTSAEARGRKDAVDPALQQMLGKTYFLAYNLHADTSFSKISSVNYQTQGGLLPWGTEVKIVRLGRNRLVVEDMNTKHQYNYEFHWKTRRAVKLGDHLGKLFVKDAKTIKAKIDQLSEIDKDGIYEGRVRIGMSRAGVMIAIGPPPVFANKQPDTARQWRYWRNRWGKMTVHFGRRGTVSEIVGYN